jgi:hypothetical protein
MKWIGKSNRLSGSVDLVLLPRISKGIQVLVAIMGDLVSLSFATMEEREWKMQSSPEVKDDYLYLSQISSHWGWLTPESPVYKGRSLRCHPKSPASKDSSLQLPGDKTLSFRPGSSETLDRQQRLAPLRWKMSLGGQSLAIGIKVSGLEGRSLRFWGSESPPRKSPTTRFLQSSLQQIAKGVKEYILYQNDFTPAFHRATPLDSTET